MIEIGLFVIGIMLLLSTIRELMLVKSRMTKSDRLLKTLRQEAETQWPK
jgi:hypothetical protein